MAKLRNTSHEPLCKRNLTCRRSFLLKKSFKPLEYIRSDVFSMRKVTSLVGLQGLQGLRGTPQDSAGLRDSVESAISPLCLSLGFMFPASRLFRKACFRSGRFPLVPGRPMGFRGVWVSDSSSRRRDTPGKRVSGKLDFHWFLADQWGFEVFGPRIHVPHIELPLRASWRVTLSILADNVILTRLQTNTQTIIYFVRPSFQSRELWVSTSGSVRKILTRFYGHTISFMYLCEES